MANDGHELDALTQKVNETVRNIYGLNSVQAQRLTVDTLRPNFSIMFADTDISIRGNIDIIRDKVAGAATAIRTQIEILQEQLREEAEDPEAKALRAYDGLSLHPEIDRAASKLYHDGHYANAVESAVKALNGLVRMRSRLEEDGSKLMDQAFGGKEPALPFNKLADESDRNEQQGFHMLFKGAVAGLRNPRAHSFVEDSPERALEFIAFVSLLAKILDEVAR